MSELEEVAKTTGKAIDASRELGGFIEKYVGPPLEQLSGMLEDYLRVWRWERQIRLFERADTFMAARGLASATRPVPLKLAIPIIQNGSLEEDDELQDRWASLLVNSADADSGTEMRSAFISILKDLTSLDAINLQQLYSYAAITIRTAGLPEEVYAEGRHGEIMKPEIAVSLSNLSRLGLISLPSPMDGGEFLFQVSHTRLGGEFVKACSPSRRKI